MNHPIGVNSIYKNLIKKFQNPHKVEHMMMDCIAETIFLSQRNNSQIDSQFYLSCLRNIKK